MSWRPPSHGEDVSVFLATAKLPDPPMTVEEKREAMAAAKKLMQAKYDAGLPFFTKNIFRDVVRQLESKDNPDQKVFVTGLDGQAVRFPLQTGEVFTDFDGADDYVCVITKPRLLYHPITDTLSVRNANYSSLLRAYLAVEVAHSTEVRSRHTNETVDLWPSLGYLVVKQRLEDTKRTLKASEHFAQLKATLTSVRIPSGINKIVALACSTMTWADEDAAMPSMAQHTLALTLRDFLVTAYSSTLPDDEECIREIECYAQDPIYTPVDEQVLSEAGFTILDDPRAFLEIDEGSIVISISPDIPVRQIVADIARPAMMIWDKSNASDPDRTDPASTRVEHMLEEYIELPFPGQRELFGDLAIYIKKGE